MKKMFFALMAWLTWAVPSLAADGITAADVEVPQGGSAVVEIQLVSEENSYGGFQFELKLPAGISATKVEKAARLTAIDNFTLSMNKTDAENNIYTVLGYNIERQSISGNAGAIAYVTLQADAGLTVGDVLTGTVQGVVISTVDEVEVSGASSSFGITVADPRVVLDETSTAVPDAAVGVDVRVRRTIYANEWSTLCLPFAMTEAQVKAAFGDDVQLADFAGTDTEFDDLDNVIGITANFNDVTAIEANHPYIIKVSSAVSSFDVDGVDIEPDEDEAYIEFDNGKSGSRRVVLSGFYGSLRAGTVLEENTLFLSENKFWYSAGLTTMKAFRAYFDFLDVLTEVEEAGARIVMNFDGETTDIGAINNGEWMMDDVYYDLQGRPVKTPTKGVYIKNGKKVIVK